MPRAAKKKAATPKQRVSRGSNALKLLENSVIQDAMDSLEEQYISDWMRTDPDQVDLREQAHSNLRVLQDFKTRLESFVADGKIAGKQLDKMQEV